MTIVSARAAIHNWADTIVPMSRIASNGPLALVRQRSLELLGLSGLAITQPLFDLLTRNASIVSSRSMSPWEMIVVCLGIVMLPVAVAIALELGVGLVAPRSVGAVHLLFSAMFVALIVMQIVKHNTTVSPVIILIGAAVLSALAAVLIARSNNLRSGLRFLAFAQILFVVMALAFSPLTNIVFGGDVSAVRAHVDRPHRVVMLLLDEFPLASLLRSDGSGLIDADLFPNFASLASQSHWYRNTTTVSPLTEDAVPALLSGKYPKHTQLPPTISNHPNNLFTALGNTYSLNVHEAVTVMCVLPQCEGKSDAARRTSPLRKIAGVLNDSGHLWWSYAEPRRTSSEVDLTLLVEQAKTRPLDTARRFVASIQPSATPRLDFLHVLLPHAPWQYLKDGSATNASGRSPGWARVWKSDWAGLSARQRHLMQLQATDSLLGQMIDRLKAIQAFDDSLIVVTGDHGVAFDTGEPNRGVSQKNAAHIAWTPLFIKYPNDTKGVIDNRPAHSIDVLPTMAETLGIRLPWKMDGRSLLSAPAAEAPRRLFDFKLNTWHPDKGKQYIELDPKRFSEVLAGAPTGNVGDPLRLFRMVPHGEIVGREVSSFGRGMPSAFTGRIRESARYQRIKLNTGNVEWADITGTTSGLKSDSYLAVAVNGTVSAVIPIRPDAAYPNRAKWWGRLLPDPMQNGSNEMQLYEVQTVDGKVRLGSVKIP